MDISNPAWIGVVGTVAGVVTSGFFGFLVAWQNRRGLKDQTRIQLEGQGRQFEIQTAADLNKWRREVRRDSYAALLVGVEHFRNLIAPLTKAFPGEPYISTSDELKVIRSLVSDLQIRYDAAFELGQVVRLEGPLEVAAAAKKILEKMTFLANAAEERTRAAEGGHEPEHRLWSDAIRETSEALEEFIITASAAVESS